MEKNEPFTSQESLNVLAPPQWSTGNVQFLQLGQLSEFCKKFIWDLSHFAND